MNAPPLHGCRVLLTRPNGRSANLARRLRELGAEVAEHPTIAFESLVDSVDVSRAVAGLADYALVLFTSPTGVEFFRAALSARTTGPIQLRSPVAAIGPGTARALRDLDVDPVIIAQEARSEGLAAAAEGFDVRGKKVLVVRPERALDGLVDRLRAAGAAVEAVAFYRTVASPGAAEAARLLCEAAIDAVVFASPSAFRSLLESGSIGLVREAVGRVRRVAIGPVTAAALEAEGLGAHAVADAPTDDAVARAVVSVLRP